MARKKQETGMDRLKKVALWQWGLIVILAGLLSNVLMGSLGPSGGSTAEQQGAMWGRICASVFFVLVGIVLIVMHFVRNLRK